MPSSLDAPANVARFGFEASTLPSDTFHVVSFEGTEGLSELFSFKLRLSSQDAALEFGQVVGHPATFTMDRAGETVPLCGLVTNLRQAGRSAAGYAAYEVTLHPRLWRLSLQENSRVFQQKSVPDILEQLLKERLGFSASQDFQLRLKASYPQREYCVQHEETDLAFFNRLTRREGIYYWFDHAGARDTLVLCDDRCEHEKIGAPDVLRYGAGDGMNRSVNESAQHFAVRQRLVEEAAELHSYNYRIPNTELRANERIPSEGSASSGNGTEAKSQKVTDAFPDASEGARLAKVRAEEVACRRRRIEGRSDCAGLRAGRLFSMAEHYRRDLNETDYLVVRITHEGSQRGALPPGGGIVSEGPLEGRIDNPSAHAAGDGASQASMEGPSYRNSFECLSAGVQFRPAYDPSDKPRLPGLTTATVENSGSNEGGAGYPYLDEEGRYRARLHFDSRSGRAQGTATLPIRMAQPSSGPGAGTHLPNPAGTELVIGHVEGDPDRPLALGTAPNPSQKSPVTAKNRSQSIVRTPGGNEFVLEDKKDKQFARLKTPGGHVVELSDARKTLEARSANGHRLTLFDEKKRAELQTVKGHRLLLDDERERVEATTKKGHRVLIDQKNELLEVSDAEGKNSVRIDCGADQITVESQEGGVALKAPKGEVAIESKTFRLETEGKAEHKVGGTLTATAGKSMTLSADGGSFEASSSQSVSVTATTGATFKSNTTATVEGGAQAVIKAPRAKMA